VLVAATINAWTRSFDPCSIRHLACRIRRGFHYRAGSWNRARLRPALVGAAAGAMLLAVLTILLGRFWVRYESRYFSLLSDFCCSSPVCGGCARRSLEQHALFRYTAAFSSEIAQLRNAGPVATLVLDPIAVVTPFQAVVLEGTEVDRRRGIPQDLADPSNDG
jgi:Ca2+/H+ antiporter, TMEM165/GDT1 family